MKQLLAAAILFFLVGLLYEYFYVSPFFTSNRQLHSTIQREFADEEYELFEVDFLGFGKQNYVTMTNSVVDQNSNTKPRIIIFDQKPLNPFEEFLYPGGLSKKVYDIQFLDQLVFADINEIKVIKERAVKKRIFFCIAKRYCGFIDSTGDGYAIKPLSIEDPNRKDFCERYVILRSNKGPVTLSLVPFGSKFFFENDDKELYIAAPLVGGKVIWGGRAELFNHTINEKYQQQVCMLRTSKIPKWLEDDVLFLSVNHREYCYRTNEEFLEPYGINYESGKAESYNQSQNALRAEIQKNVGLPDNIKIMLESENRHNCAE